MGAGPPALEVSAHVSPVLSPFVIVAVLTMPEPGRGTGSPWSDLHGWE